MGKLENIISTIIKKNMKITIRMYLIVAFSAIVLASVLAIGAFSLQRFSNIMITKTQNYSMIISTQIKNGLNSALLSLNKKVDQVMKDAYLRSVLAQNGSPTKEEFVKIIEDYFDPFSIESSYIESIDLYLKSEDILHYGKNEDYITDIFNGDYFKKGIRRPTLLNWIGYNESNNTIEAVRLLFNKVTYEIEGILVIRINKLYLFETFMNNNRLEINNMYIVNEDGQILSCSDISKIGSYFTKEYQKSMNKLFGYIEQKDQLILYQRLQSFEIINYAHEKWNVIIEINKKMAFRDVYNMTNTIIEFMAIFVLLGILISILISLKITVPVRRLVGGMKKVAHGGGFDINIEPTGTSEMLFLTESFNTMLQKIKTLIKDVYEEKILRTDMELKALQRQMNPHFTFNTLHIIGWKALEHDDHEVYEMIKSFSYLIEANLERKDEKLITVQKEITYMENYIYLTKKKYGGKISFTIDISEDIYNCMIPKLLLQPFIENSIKHGIINKFGPGKIMIKGYVENGNIHFCIADDGVGIKKEKLQQIKSMIEGDLQEESTESIALQNTYKRIKLIYGDRYGLSINSELYKGTTVEIIIPMLDVE